ncbi:MAG: hypothetical protein IKH58_11475 [Bacteroidales bacterium]|nr:hypothetical protein [Bacteroidales bacterium]MBR3540554.1 hypothetical protein [Bacteroidales bacterium]
MQKSFLLLLFLVLSLPMRADNLQLMDSLDAAIAQRSQYIQVKSERIASLKRKLNEGVIGERTLSIIDDLYEEYHVFQFDSAMLYADRGLAMALQQRNSYFTTLFTIHRSEILAIGGLYSEALECMKTLDDQPTDSLLRFKQLIAYNAIYSYWSDYCHDVYYAPLYRSKADSCLRQAIGYVGPDNPLYDYYQGEKNVYLDHDGKQARIHYLQAVKRIDQHSRAYSMASFALAGNYRVAGEQDKYIEYVIKAAMCDLKNCTMENLALQDLAVCLFDESEEQITRAELYINTSMEDAKFYNNRLRILEISRTLPQIMNTYQATIVAKNQKLRNSVVFISLLVLALLLTAYYIYKQNRKLASRRRELASSHQKLINMNKQLADSNKTHAALNQQLKELNQQLIHTNKRREGLASIFIDLCAKYIDKLGMYQTLVKRKIKANQAQDLLHTISSTRISEQDASTFLHRFDKAFLDLYPTFVEEFNALLSDEGQIAVKSPGTLTTELRTFALIRLGVKNTADIAGLLFLSPQTIYNCRSVMKGKARRRETFDDDVQRLCTVN